MKVHNATKAFSTTHCTEVIVFCNSGGPSEGGSTLWCRCEYDYNRDYAIKDGLQKTGAARNVISKASKLVGHVRHSSHATEILGDGPKLQQKNSTRWNSSNKMLKSILKADSDSLSQINSPVTLNKTDLKTIREVTDILTPFEEATSQCEGQNHVTSSMVIPFIYCLKAELQELLPKYKSEMLRTLISSVDRRLKIFEDSDIFQIATILDPRYKLTWCQEDQLEEVKTLLVNKFKAFSPVSQSSNSEPASPPKKSKLLRHLPGNRSQPPPPSTTPQEIESYLNSPLLDEDCNILQFWCAHKTKYPTLAALARKYLCVPASSAPVERLFSMAGKVFTKERSRLTDSHFEDLMFIKCNMHL